MLAPILVFTAEEAREAGPLGGKSVHLEAMPKAAEGWIDADLDRKWLKLLELRDEVSIALEAT